MLSGFRPGERCGLGSVRDRFGVGLGSVWGRFGVGSGSVWGRFGVGLGSVRGRYGVPGSLEAGFCLRLGYSVITKKSAAPLLVGIN